MTALRNYVLSHAVKCTPAEGADVVFFAVKELADATAAGLREVVTAHRSNGDVPDLFDGREHSYIEIGAWLDDQGLALVLMGLGARLGLWTLLTPRNMLTADASEAQKLELAGQGLVTIIAPQPSTEPG